MLPIQPTHTDHNGTLRFRQNRVVRYLLDHGGLDMSKLHLAEELSDCAEDWQQFAQLIGYSVYGFGTLPYVDTDTYGTVVKMVTENILEKDAKIAYLEGQLHTVKAALRQLVPQIFDVHPDSLK